LESGKGRRNTQVREVAGPSLSAAAGLGSLAAQKHRAIVIRTSRRDTQRRRRHQSDQPEMMVHVKIVVDDWRVFEE
jgi:hypothetical protein